MEPTRRAAMPSAERPMRASAASPDPPRLGSIIALCVVLGVVLRALLLHWSADAEPLLDEAFYLSLAIHLQQFGVYVGKWAPGYPYVLAFALQLLGPAALLGIKLVQLALSGVIGASTIALAARAFDRRAALVAAAS